MYHYDRAMPATCASVARIVTAQAGDLKDVEVTEDRIRPFT